MERGNVPVSTVLNRNILLGVSGGIAAYKAAFIVRELVKAGCQVQVVMTPAAHDFVTPLTLATLSKRPVLTDLFERDGSGKWNDHVHLARWADLMLIAPATANTIAKMAQGICDNLLLACYQSSTCPVVIAPAMDLEMWKEVTTSTNIERLHARGVGTIGPGSGELASGLNGEGRMSEPEEILEHLRTLLVGKGPLQGRRVLISAGPTQEAIDPVRYIGNRSTGKMGFALAEEAALRGAHVQLVAGPVQLTLDRPGIVRTDVGTAEEMASACKALAKDCDVVIMSAAVADMRPKRPAKDKIKKATADLVLDLEPTEDILSSLSASRPAGQLVVGFALETTDELAHGTAKLQRKKLDLLVLNSLQDTGAGFGHDTNKVTLLAPGKDPQELPLMSKVEVARAILDRIEAQL
ncbi:MAG: bifunctional phosphopantothenoylcysteine decarboxylase/phosphopantothenate--cysteine ligase CoaBC [Flavobacteriales bacterium]|jgi:phosphopantothenoylcysteine decarboxylase/phosphopantothenate--cysteine ligase|nr:bifunctional phosphopantothenoylcysteine decarboxylase/phosphopantothenate--cysteine ligase CoaBC [Flavobacteriales bacterium]MBK9513261.1 bifunctional phosphopantothenoylcysteine decarboxylase/phosphopantothenate--cysteine ligase CoaBC [Flavobacteriales bacterium]MBP7450139.1 bifunctional phosphopantothenoylcysteine decarboxylase/phosphopantothenate--cysteine ligase CoaBC [Flavobacteriales bacterium]HOZ39867.1 bifunctional phosphopantothenoylcysteine decarboxylase/phosphopantothenate--cystei